MNAIFNPKNLPVNDLPIIYGFPNGSFGNSDVVGVLLAADGTSLGSHISSEEEWSIRDLGILEDTRPDRHETFREHYPEGYRMEYVYGKDIESTLGLLAAIKLANEQPRAPKGGQASVSITITG